MRLNEENRNQLIAGSKNGPIKGKQRYKRRVKSRVANSVKEFNSIDMNKLFKDNILTVNVKVHGETDDYLVGISFGGFLDVIKDQIKDRPDHLVDLRDITRALVICFNRNDVFIRCDCKDFFYRFGYWTSKNDIITGEKQTIPSDITNPNNDLGTACKHVLLVLSNTSFLIKIASVINNYIKYIEKHYKRLYADIIYPAVYGKKYEEPVQLQMDEPDELETGKDTIDVANKERVQDTRFQKGNTQGVRFAKEAEDAIPDQLSIDTEVEEKT